MSVKYVVHMHDWSGVCESQNLGLLMYEKG